MSGFREPPEGGSPGGAAFAAIIALVGPIAAMGAWTLQHKWEGTRLAPYRDPIGIVTECSGITGRIDPRHRNTPAECDDKDARALLVATRESAKCTPALKQRPYIAAAVIDFTLNLGGPTYCGSTVMKRFNAGDWRGGCEFMINYRKAGGHVLPGLEARRRDEITNYCLKGIGK